MGKQLTEEQKLKTKEYMARYRAENREKLNAYSSAYFKEYRKKNKTHLDAYIKEHRKSKPYMHSAYAAKRRASLLKATPVWADLEAIKCVYQEAQYFGYQVDHIVPLQGKNVCGLHVVENLQILPPSENSRKGNKFDESLLA